MSDSPLKPAHPPVSKMVKTAIEELSTRKGTSLPAIKKYISTNYEATLNTRMIGDIGRYLNRAVDKGDLIRIKGTGANGSFKLNPKKPSKPKQPKAAAATAAKNKPVTLADITAALKPVAPKAAKPKVTVTKATSPKPGKAPKAIKSPVKETTTLQATSD